MNYEVWLETAHAWLIANVTVLGSLGAVATIITLFLTLRPRKTRNDNPPVQIINNPPIAHPSGLVDRSSPVPAEFAASYVKLSEQRLSDLEAELKAKNVEIAGLQERSGEMGARLADRDLLERELDTTRTLLADKDRSIAEAWREAGELKAELKTLRGAGNAVSGAQLDEAIAALETGDLETAQDILEAMRENDSDVSAIARQARIEFSLGKIAEQRIDYQRSKSHFVRAVELQPDNTEFLLAAEKIARQAGDVTLSSRMTDRLLPMAGNPEHDRANDTTNLANIIDAIGSSYQVRGLFSEAQTYFDRSLEISQRVLGQEHPSTASSYNNVASNLDDQGRYEDAEPLYRRGLEIHQRVLGEEHPSTASSYNNLAYNLNAQGRYEEAESLSRRDLEINHRVLGEEHPSTATSYNNVAANLNAQGRYEEAESLFRRGLEIRQRVLGEEHPSTATSYNNVASSLNALGRYEDAEPLYRRGLEIHQRVLGEEHPSTATGYNNVAYNLNAQGRFEEAESLFRRGLRIRQRVLGEEHPLTATSYNNVAANLNAQGRYEEAESLYRKAVEIMYRVLGARHPDTKLVLGNLVRFLTERGRAIEIEDLRVEFPGSDE